MTKCICKRCEDNFVISPARLFGICLTCAVIGMLTACLIIQHKGGI
jgi:hypothetical protein